MANSDNKKTTKKSSTSAINWNKITGICAFLAIVIAGLIFAINGIVKLFEGSFNGGILNTIATLFLVAGLVIPGWRYTKTKAMWIQIIFWVCAIILIIFGAIGFNI